MIKAPKNSSDLARRAGAWVQIGFLIAMFVLWRVLRWHFATAAEACVTAGVLVYSALNVYAAIVIAWSGKANFLPARLTRLTGVILYIVMRYVMHYGFIQSVLVWVALWFVAAVLSSHARRRAIGGAPITLKVSAE